MKEEYNVFVHYTRQLILWTVVNETVYIQFYCYNQYVHQTVSAAQMCYRHKLQTASKRCTYKNSWTLIAICNSSELVCSVHTSHIFVVQEGVHWNRNSGIEVFLRFSINLLHFGKSCWMKNQGI